MLLIHFQIYKKMTALNAQYDGVSIESSKNIWVDHCHFKDTVELGHVHLAGGELTKWQTYDGLCDIKGRQCGYHDLAQHL